MKGVVTHRSLDVLVADVAHRLMGTDAVNATSITEEVLSDLREYFGVDHSCLRTSDHTIRASILVAESPPRAGGIPDPDPLGVIYFADADPVFAMAEHALEPVLVRPGSEGYEGYRQRVEEGAPGVVEVSCLASPMVPGAATSPIGFISLTRFSDRVWRDDEVRAMKAIAALFAQMHGRIEAERQLRHIATHDDLTGLSNRRALLDYMQRRLECDGAGPVAVLYIDLDRLKALNDFLGHTAGDEFICALARRLRDHTDPRDMIARLGGDEFVLVPAQPLTAAGAHKEAERVQNLVRERVAVGGENVTRSVSIGVAVGIPGDTTVADLLRQADQAVLAAKTSGGDAIAVFTEQMRSEAELRDDIELHLRGSVESDSLLLHYQPEVDLRTGRIVGLEALVRWRHPTRGVLQPSMFIEVAEATNYAGELGRWVIRNACAQLTQWRAAGLAHDVVLRVNVSPVQLVSLDFVTTVEEALAQHHLSGESLCLEITESVVVQDLPRTRATLGALKAIGVKVAIDDFGSGYSSLAHLKALPVDTLKIDRGFVQRLDQDTDDHAIVKSIVGLADSFGIDIVAEGVEEPIAARTLMQLGCYRAQGFLIARPLEPDDAAAALERGVISFQL